MSSNNQPSPDAAISSYPVDSYNPLACTSGGGLPEINTTSQLPIDPTGATAEAINFETISCEGPLCLTYYNRDEHKRRFEAYVFDISEKKNSLSLTANDIQQKITTIIKNSSVISTTNENCTKKKRLEPQDRRVLGAYDVYEEETALPPTERGKVHYLKLNYPLLMRKSKVGTTLFVIASENKFDVIEKEMVRGRQKVQAKPRHMKEERLNTQRIHQDGCVNELGLHNITRRDIDTWYDLYKELTNLVPPTLPPVVMSGDPNHTRPIWTLIPISFKDDIRCDVEGNKKDTLVVMLNDQSDQIMAHPVMLDIPRSTCVVVARWWHEAVVKPIRITYPWAFNNWGAGLATFMNSTPHFPRDVPFENEMVAFMNDGEATVPSTYMILSDLKAHLSTCTGNWTQQFYTVLNDKCVPICDSKQPRRLMDKSSINSLPKHNTHASLKQSPEDSFDDTNSNHNSNIPTPRPAANVLGVAVPVEEITANFCCIYGSDALEHWSCPGEGCHKSSSRHREISPSLHCVDCADTKDGWRSVILTVRTQPYHDYLLKSEVWFETDFINTFGILIQHDNHCCRTWFYPCKDGLQQDNKDVKVSAQLDDSKIVLIPFFVDRVVAVLHLNLHYAVLDIDNARKTIIVYDGFQHKYNQNDVTRWKMNIIGVLRRIGWIHVCPAATVIPDEWFVRSEDMYKQYNQNICGGVACKVIEYLFRCDHVPNSFRTMTGKQVREEVLSTFDHLFRKYGSSDLFIIRKTKAAKRFVLSKRVTEPGFKLSAIPTSSNPFSEQVANDSQVLELNSDSE
jgi:Ulp1 protease family, C-terminal catalytic domain